MSIDSYYTFEGINAIYNTNTATEEILILYKLIDNAELLSKIHRFQSVLPQNCHNFCLLSIIFHVINVLK